MVRKRFVRQRIFIFTICQTLSFSLVKLWNVLLSSSPKLSSQDDCFNLENGLAVGEARVSIFCSTLHNHIITETNYALKFVKASTSSVSPWLLHHFLPPGSQGNLTIFKEHSEWCVHILWLVLVWTQPHYPFTRLECIAFSYVSPSELIMQPNFSTHIPHQTGSHLINSSSVT